MGVAEGAAAQAASERSPLRRLGLSIYTLHLNGKQSLHLANGEGDNDVEQTQGSAVCREIFIVPNF